MDEYLIPEDRFSNANVHHTFPATEEDIIQHNERLLAFETTEINTDKAVLKKSDNQHDLLIKNSIESGMSHLTKENVRKLASYSNVYGIHFNMT